MTYPSRIRWLKYLNHYSKALYRAANCQYQQVTWQGLRSCFYSSHCPTERKAEECGSVGQTHTVRDALHQWTRKFKEEKIPEPDLSAGYIIGHVLGFKRAFLDTPEMRAMYATDLMTRLDEKQTDRINGLCQKRLQRMPIQYVLGEWDFRFLTLSMKQPVFIPRQETEELVGLVLHFHRKKPNLHFLEIGCGSGAISLSILHELQQSTGVAIDQSVDAINLTRHNAKRLCLSDRIQTHRCELSDSPRLPDCIMGKYDIIVSNPPYIFQEDMPDLAPEITRYEDPKALKGGVEGMDVTLRILNMARHLLLPGGSIWLEGDPRHPAMIQKWLRTNPHTQVQLVNVLKDFCQRTRFCHLKYLPYKR
ncbi:MTRF1L release factor glutamine methyltransferase-like [Ptychodera flava]|uniref:MTRF1L release factor glutamine methyltransferase-like n=1 Tax=Ptychodera flava TaxID=63121 RepID=UPI00396AA0A3